MLYIMKIPCSDMDIFHTDPIQWTRNNVCHWLSWATKEFGLSQIDPDKFPFSGPQLCNLSKEEFLSRAPPYTGDILHSHLNLLKAKSGEEMI